MLQMDFLIVTVALPQIQAELGFTAAGLSWVPNAFALAFGGLLLLGGKLGDLFGRVRMFRIGLAVFVAASLMGGLAQNQAMLIAARVLQGIGGAVAAPSVLALVTTLARTDAERARGLSLFIAVSSIGASAGLILGGALTEVASWRWSLLINVPVGIVVVLLIGRLVEETSRAKVRLDVGGALACTVASAALVYGFIDAAEHGWGAVGAIAGFVAAAVTGTMFFRLQQVRTDPLFDLNLLRHRNRGGGLIVMAGIVGMHFATLFLLAQYFQRILGFGPLLAGLAYLPLTATVFCITHFVPALLERFGPRTLLVGGSLAVAASLFGFATIGASSSYWSGVLPALILHSVGIALVFAPGTVVIMEGIPEEQAGAASGLLQMDQQIGGALGIAVIASAYAATAVPGDFATGLPAAFCLAGCVGLVTAAVAARLVRARNR
jgi:EmrB/QacA subfamily drug resistance transporter